MASVGSCPAGWPLRRSGRRSGGCPPCGKGRAERRGRGTLPRRRRGRGRTGGAGAHSSQTRIWKEGRKKVLERVVQLFLFGGEDKISVEAKVLINEEKV